MAGVGLWSLAVSIDGHDSGEVALSAAIAALLCAPHGWAVRDALRTRRC